MSGSRRAWRTGVLLVLAGLVAFAIVAWVQVHSRPSGNPATISVTIPRGAGGDTIVGLLEQSRVTEHPTALKWVLRLSGTYRQIQAGTYTFPGDANALEVEEILGAPPDTGAHLILTLIPGESVWEAADRIAALGIGDASEVVALAADHAYVSGLGLPVGPPREPRTDGAAHTYLEGFLYPDTYFLPLDATPRDAVERAAAQFLVVWGRVSARLETDLRAIAARHGLTTLDVITMASLIEEEAQARAEGPRIAGVFYNRLAKGMRLQTDPTLVYRPDRQGRAPTRADRLDATNPYNTYAIAGLPPGPIASPAEQAIEAALRPERHDLLFFVAMRDGTGRHAFSRTLAEHEANIDRYLRR